MKDFQESEIQQEKYEGIRGYFKVNTYKDNELIETYEDNNLIMDSARDAMQLMQAFTTDQKPINGFKLGSMGQNESLQGGSQVLNIPKKPGTGQNEYKPSMTELFQASAGGYLFSVDWAVDGIKSNLGTLQKYPEGEIFEQNGSTTFQGTVVSNDDTSLLQKCKFQRSLEGRILDFVITIDSNQQNPQSGTASIPYSEAQLYQGDKIFSMKTFPQKHKYKGVTLEIQWSIIF